MNVTQFENVGDLKDGEVFEWKIPGWILNHKYSTKRSDVFTLNRVPDFKFCLTLRPYSEEKTLSTSFNLQLHRIRVNERACDENKDNNGVLDMAVRFILLKSDVVYKCSGVIRMGNNQLSANFHEVSTYDCLNIQCILIYPTSLPQSGLNFSQEGSTPEESKHGLSHGLLSLLNNGSFSDVTLSVQGREFAVHRCILAARSTVFSAMLNHDLKEKLENRIEISDIDSDTIQQLLKYVYTDEFDNLTPQQYLALFAAADKYDITGLRKKCAHHLKKNLPLDGLVHILIAADLHQEDDLKEATIQLFLKDPLPIMRSAEWLSFMKSHTELANSVLLRMAKKPV